MPARVTWNGAAVAAQLHDAAARGLTRAVTGAFAETQARVPVDSGELQASGRAHVDDEQLRGEIRYGGQGETQAYAAHQHEDMTLKHAGGRGAKYLEGPVVAAGETLVGLVADEARQVLG